MNKFTSKDTLIGIDHGEESTGLALGRNGLVSPLTIVRENSDESVIHEIIKYSTENIVKGCVVGLPLDAANKETQQSLRVRKFAKLLKVLSKKPVAFQNEYGTSIESLKEAIDSGVSQKGRRENDHLAAALILKDFYEGLTDL